jgi:hypothetical protein
MKFFNFFPPELTFPRRKSPFTNRRAFAQKINAFANKLARLRALSLKFPPNQVPIYLQSQPLNLSPILCPLPAIGYPSLAVKLAWAGFFLCQNLHFSKPKITPPLVHIIFTSHNCF